MDAPEWKPTSHPRAHQDDVPDDGDSVAGYEDIPSKEEILQHDHETLTGEEEAERLLGGAAEDNSGMRRVRRPRHRNQRRLEEGTRSSSATSSATSSQEDIRRTAIDRAGVKKTNVSFCGRLTALYLVICVAFLALLYGTYAATARTEASVGYAPFKTRSNGTHDFQPTTVLISLDGFRADFVHRGLTPALSSLIQQGVSPKWMNPSFPSVTAPNHYTLVTGMYPEAHGIIGNTFFDPLAQKEFYFTDPARSMTEEWWNAAEPLWQTAEQQNVPTAIHMWPGSEAHIGKMEPAYVDKYDGHESLQNKVDRILGWLDLPGPKDSGALEATPRPQLIAAYVPDVDRDGHLYGPNSTYIRSTITEVDGMVGSLLKGIEERNLTDVVNIVVVSDHGMATTSNDRLIQLEDLVNPALIEHTDGWPLYGLRPHDQSQTHLQTMYEDLFAKSQLPKYKDQFDVYLRDVNMPERYHFSQNQRIAPLWIVPRVGWAIAPKHEFDLQEAMARGEVYHPRGLHGYDNQHPLMRAIFIAKGPAFPHPEGSMVDAFQNTEVYNIVCDSLGLEPKKNNGTIRLPFKVNGRHDSDADADVDIPEDLDDFEIVHPVLLPPEIPKIVSISSSQPDPEITPSNPTTQEPSSSSAAASEATIPKPSDTSAVASDTDAADHASEPTPSKSSSWLDWANGKLQAAKAWATDVFGSHKTSSKGD
ncbi:related to nucleotide diphosphatase [Ramularia collo-cygni]|uniref:Related to nucleotide diphosphatase n=1 Tax=Ramularia collo-cygni TaxID=112498 RepID=A0A2D3URB0_9PEZI|nr:related to nucleotide diphosphatase [Ramularia collo-cygni]CZT17048.1 related to nucleotide diphosphatase [Ramularia collo-cygni]